MLILFQWANTYLQTDLDTGATAGCRWSYSCWSHTVMYMYTMLYTRCRVHYCILSCTMYMTVLHVYIAQLLPIIALYNKWPYLLFKIGYTQPYELILTYCNIMVVISKVSSCHLQQILSGVIWLWCGNQLTVKCKTLINRCQSIVKWDIH